MSTEVAGPAPPLEAPQAHDNALKTDNFPDTRSFKPKPRPQRPNHNLLHAKPLPLNVHPLPAFIPHNPLSIVRIAIALISHSIWPPDSHAIVHQGYFSAETQSVHITEWASVRALWEQGFFGSGSLSRTDPEWLNHEKRKRGLRDSRTAWAVTQDRRDARRQMKLERARKERETIEQQLEEEARGEANSATETPPPPEVDAQQEDHVSSDNGAVKPLDATEKLEIADDMVPAVEPEDELDIENQEHLQLTLEEAFFLTYGLGALHVSGNGDTLPLRSAHLLRLFCAYSRDTLSEGADTLLYQLLRNTSERLRAPSIPLIAPDNPFLLRYAVYHHYRSLGWVIRDGTKFAVDYLLYLRGPVFQHAQFALMIIPSYSHPYWSADQARKEGFKEKEMRDWWWLHRVNRVQSQALKTLMLVYVEVPPPWDDAQDTGDLDIDVGKMLKKYKVRDVTVQRWTPNRHRD